MQEKCIRLILCLIATLFILLPIKDSEAATSHWVYSESDGFDDIYYDTQNYEYDSNSNDIKIWCKFTQNGILQHKNLVDISLNTKEWTVLQTINYRSRPPRFYDLSNKEEWFPIEPTDTNVLIINDICHSLNISPLTFGAEPNWQWLYSTDKVTFNYADNIVGISEKSSCIQFKVQKLYQQKVWPYKFYYYKDKDEVDFWGPRNNEPDSGPRVDMEAVKKAIKLKAQKLSQSIPCNIEDHHWTYVTDINDMGAFYDTNTIEYNPETNHIKFWFCLMKNWHTVNMLLYDADLNTAKVYPLKFVAYSQDEDPTMDTAYIVSGKDQNAYPINFGSPVEKAIDQICDSLNIKHIIPNTESLPMLPHGQSITAGNNM